MDIIGKSIVELSCVETLRNTGEFLLIDKLNLMTVEGQPNSLVPIHLYSTEGDYTGSGLIMLDTDEDTVLETSQLQDRGVMERTSSLKFLEYVMNKIIQGSATYGRNLEALFTTLTHYCNDNKQIDTVIRQCLCASENKEIVFEQLELSVLVVSFHKDHFTCEMVPGERNGYLH